MSKLTTFVVVLMLIGTISAQQSANKHRAVGIDTLLNNNIVLTKYINCLLDIGPCTNDGRELKSKNSSSLCFDESFDRKIVL